MSIAIELYGIDEETHDKLKTEVASKVSGRPLIVAVKETINELSEAKRDQREIVTLAFMLGILARPE